MAVGSSTGSQAGKMPPGSSSTEVASINPESSSAAFVSQAANQQAGPAAATGGAASDREAESLASGSFNVTQKASLSASLQNPVVNPPAVLSTFAPSAEKEPPSASSSVV